MEPVLDKKRAQAARYRANRSEATRQRNTEVHREWQLRRSYGIGIADVRRMFDDQEGRCRVCTRHMRLFSGVKADSAAVDHCHETGRVRGLLCIKCNSGLGSFQDSPELLEAAAQYLRASRNG